MSKVLVCHTPVITNGQHVPCTTVGREYPVTIKRTRYTDDVVSVRVEYIIINDMGEQHFFQTVKGDNAHYSNWFTLKKQ